MKEQSHKEEMSAAIRADFQRLRERGVSAALAPQDTAEPEPDRTPSDEAVSPEPAVEPEAEPDEQAPEPRPEAVEAPPPGRSWLSRLTGR